MNASRAHMQSSGSIDICDTLSSGCTDMNDMTHSCSESSHMSSKCIDMCDTVSSGCIDMSYDRFHWKYICVTRMHPELTLTVSTEHAAPPKSTKSRNSDSLVSRHTDSNWDFGFESVPRNLSCSIWWILGVQNFQWHLSYDCFQNMNESCQPCHTCECIQNSYDCFQNMNESCHTCEWISHVAHMKQLRHTCEWPSCVTHMSTLRTETYIHSQLRYDCMSAFSTWPTNCTNHRTSYAGSSHGSYIWRSHGSYIWRSLHLALDPRTAEATARPMLLRVTGHIYEEVTGHVYEEV